MTTSPDIRPVAAFLWLALWSGMAAVAAVAAGYFPTRALAGPGGVLAMGVGVGSALVAGLAGLVPPLLVFRQGPRGRLNGMLAGMALRFVVILGLLLAALLSGLPEKAVLAVWAAIGYIVLLAVDTAGMVWLGQRVARSSS